MEVVGRLHLELVHSLTGAGNHQTIGIITVRHFVVLLFDSSFVGSGIRA